MAGPKLLLFMVLTGNLYTTGKSFIKIMKVLSLLKERNLHIPKGFQIRKEREIIDLNKRYPGLSAAKLKEKHSIRCSLNTIYRVLRKNRAVRSSEFINEFYLKYTKFEYSGSKKANYILFIQNIKTGQCLICFTEEKFLNGPVKFLELLTKHYNSFFPKKFIIKTDLNPDYYKDLKRYLADCNIKTRLSKKYSAFNQFINKIEYIFSGFNKGIFTEQAATALLMYNTIYSKKADKELKKLFHTYRPAFLDLYSDKVVIRKNSIIEELVSMLKSRIKSKSTEECFELFDLIYQHLRYFRNYSVKAEVLQENGILLQKLGMLNNALKLFNKSLQIAQKENDIKLVCTCEGRLAIHYNHMGKPEKAKEFILKRIETAKNNRFMNELAGGYLTLGVWELNKENYSVARECNRKVVEISEKTGDLKKQVKAMANLGVIEYKCGNYDKALNHYTSAFKKAETAGDFRQCAWISGNIGIIHSAEKQFFKAREYYQVMLKYSKYVQDKYFEYNALNNMGTIEFDLKNYDQAFKYYFEVYGFSEKSGNLRIKMVSCYNLAEVLFELNRTKQASSFLERSLKLAKELDDKEMVANINKMYSFNIEKGK